VEHVKVTENTALFFFLDFCYAFDKAGLLSHVFSS
jgi:hypothetical protein